MALAGTFPFRVFFNALPGGHPRVRSNSFLTARPIEIVCLDLTRDRFPKGKYNRTTM